MNPANIPLLDMACICPNNIRVCNWSPLYIYVYAPIYIFMYMHSSKFILLFAMLMKMTCAWFLSPVLDLDRQNMQPVEQQWCTDQGYNPETITWNVGYTSYSYVIYTILWQWHQQCEIVHLAMCAKSLYYQIYYSYNCYHMCSGGTWQERKLYSCGYQLTKHLQSDTCRHITSASSDKNMTCHRTNRYMRTQFC